MNFKPFNNELQWPEKNHLACATVFYLQKENCMKALEKFKGKWRSEILNKGHGQSNLLTHSIDQSGMREVFYKYQKPVISIAKLPSYSFFLQIQFILATACISKDENDFYIIENPVKKDILFKIPIIPGTTWKGHLRWTAGKAVERAGTEGEKIATRLQSVKLFGNENVSQERYFDSMMSSEIGRLRFAVELKQWANKDRLRKGRLNFYPTFFQEIGLEVINPHDRKTKAGTNPIFIESVPVGAKGIFSLLYSPFDLVGRSNATVKENVAADLNLVFDTVREMMLTYGFSAKKSSGFGVIEDNFEEGTFTMKDKPTRSFKNFDEMETIIETVSQEILEG